MNKDNQDNLTSIINHQPLHKIVSNDYQESCHLTPSFDKTTSDKETILSYSTADNMKVCLHFPTAPQSQAPLIEQEIKAIIKKDFLSELQSTYFTPSTNEKET